MNRHHPIQSVTRRLSGDLGASLVEYTLLISLIAVVCLTALTAFGSATRDSVSDSASEVTSAGS